MKFKTSWVLIAFGFSGAAALIYEVVWTRALSLVLGSTTYALSAMLSTFMAGLAAGGYAGGKLADRRSDLPRLFGFCEGGIGVFGLLTVPLIYALPPIYLSVYRAYHVAPTVFLGFQFILCSAVMLAPTTLMGLTFPLVARMITTDVNGMGSTVGNAYAANTVGAIAGAFLAGFVLIPGLGIKMTAFVAAGINLVLAVLIIAVFSRARLGILFLAVCFVLAGGISAFSREKTTFVTFYTAFRFPENVPPGVFIEGKGREHQLLFYREDQQGSVRLYREREGSLLLQTGGKIEGTLRREMPNTLLLAYLPIAAHPRPDSLLVVGLGTGVTLAAAKERVKDVDVVEINPGVVEALNEFGQPGLLRGVGIHTADARQYLLLSDKRYDIISSEPSYPADAAIANLFTREYYELARERLNPGGIYCQWLPYYILTDEDMAMMAKTFGSVFEYVFVWKVGTSLDRIMIGSNVPFVYGPDAILRRVRDLNTTELALNPVLSRGPDQIAELVGTEGVPVNTDDHPLLEFHTVRNLIAGGAHPPE